MLGRGCETKTLQKNEREREMGLKIAEGEEES